jgi:hypothetical protein
LKYFYSHLVEIETLTVELNKLELTPDERRHLANLVDESLHHAVLDAILSKLTDQEKIIFFEHLKNGREDKIWELLSQKSENIDKEIKQVVAEVKKDLHQDIKEAKKLK